MKLNCARYRPLQLLVFNKEFLSHQLALTTFLPFVHTARRYYRLNGLARSSDWSVKLCLNWIGVASDCLTFTLNYWSDNIIVTTAITVLQPFVNRVTNDL